MTQRTLGRKVVALCPPSSRVARELAPTLLLPALQFIINNGGIDTENLSLESKEQSRRRLTGDLNGGGPEIRIETTNGGVTLRGKS